MLAESPSGSSTAVLDAEPAAVRAGEAVACAHCSLPVPPGLVDADHDHQFCCHGCEAAYELIHGTDLAGYYDICEQLDTHPPQAADVKDSCDEFDHPAFAQRHVRTLPDGLSEVRLHLEGIHCAACVWLLEKLPRLLPGVVSARVDLARRVARVQWDANAVSLSRIARRLRSLGYGARPAGVDSKGDEFRAANRRHLVRLAIAGACAGNAMLLAVAMYAGWFSGIAEDHSRLLRLASAVLGTVSLLGPGATFYRGAWSALRTRTPHMDISLTLGLAAGGVMGLVNTWRGTGEIYFDSLCMLVFVLLTGRYMQFRQQRHAAERVAVLRGLVPCTAWRIDAEGCAERVPVEALSVGDVVEVRVGDALPADGTVVSGTTHLDESLLTGESAGIRVSAGDSAPAGAINLTAPIRVRVDFTGHDTRVGRLSALVEEASMSRTPLVELANRASGVFLLVVLAVAGGTLAGWWSSGVDRAVEHTIALLIVACPCALGLATPLTIAVAIGQAARGGLLIRSGDVFELLSRRGTIWLDKTGTLTTGDLSLRGFHGDRSVAPFVRTLEAGISHPVASSLVRVLDAPAWKDRSAATTPLPDESSYFPGSGVAGKFGDAWIECGSRRWLESRGADMTAADAWLADATVSATTIHVARNGRVVAMFLLGDTPRVESRATVETLRRAGWRVGMLSGDQPEIARAVAREVGIEPSRVIAGVLPEEKLEIIRRDAAEGRVVMVGDGVNDAAALAAADVGIAVHGGAEASLRAAKVYLTRPGLAPLEELFTGSDRAMSAIRRGLALSLAYNVTAVTLAACGLVTPLLAAILMPLSSLSVIALATLQRAFPGSTSDARKGRDL
jgi:Cu2+-exporting ATPase